MVTIDDRGQIVLPKYTRERAGLNTDDKLALIVWKSENKVCCRVDKNRNAEYWS